MHVNTAIVASELSHTERGTENRHAVAASSLSDKHERFVQELMLNGGNLGEAYHVVYPNAGSRHVIWVNAARLRARKDVSERIAQLTAVAADQAVISIQRQLVDLAEMAAVDIAGIERIVHRACPACEALYDRDLLALRPVPDLAADDLAPHPDCAASRAHTRHELLPMDAWPAAARRLYEGVEIARDGTLRPVFRDRNQIQDMVNRMLGAYVSRSVNTNLNVNVDPSKPNPWSGASLTPEQVLQRVRRARAPITIEQLPSEPTPSEASPSSEAPP